MWKNKTRTGGALLFVSFVCVLTFLRSDRDVTEILIDIRRGDEDPSAAATMMSLQSEEGESAAASVSSAPAGSSPVEPSCGGGDAAAAVSKDNSTAAPARTRLLEIQNKVAFIHPGKSGGGTVRSTLRHGYKILMRHCHPIPCNFYVDNEDRDPHYNNHYPPPRRMLVTLRDPIDRFLSAFYWRVAIHCDPYDDDPRIPLRAGVLAGNILSRPDKFCKSEISKDEKKFLFKTYRKNATMLAEELCYDRSNPKLADRAREGIMSIVHLGKYGLVDWLNGINSDGSSLSPSSITWESNFRRYYPIVLEPAAGAAGVGSLESQLEAAVDWLHDEIDFEDVAAAAAQEQQNSATSIQPESPASHDGNHTRSKRRRLKQRLHSSSILKVPLSAKAERCLAEYYRDDYRLLEDVLMHPSGMMCKSDDCRAGIRSILDRRRKLLREVDGSSSRRRRKQQRKK